MSPEKKGNGKKEEPLRTWSELAEERKIPDSYEVVTRNIHYNTNLNFELSPDDQVVEWYRKYREGGDIQAEDIKDWDNFQDPDRTTYEAYNKTMDERESFIDTLHKQMAELEYSEEDEEWIVFLAQAFTPLRFPVHALQMVSNYGTMISPSSRISNCFVYQAMDERRRLDRLAYRSKQLELEYPDQPFTEEREQWEDDPVWQPLRETLENLLIEYDWGRAFTALNLVVKPLFDEMFNQQFSQLSWENDRHLTAEWCENFYLDTARSRKWSKDLAEFIVEQDSANQEVMQSEIDKWFPKMITALKEFRPFFEELPPESMNFDEVHETVQKRYRDKLMDDLPLRIPRVVK